jgi:hypothetical protein
MISPQVYTQEWIMGIRETSPRMDPILIEKMIMALALVENLRLSGLDFIFKGGTALTLVTGKLQRFSIDIDIIISTPHNLSECFQIILKQGTFLRYEEDKREGNIPKAHYKFFFNSVIQSKESHILLDILFEENLYVQFQEIEIRSPLLLIGDESTRVFCPVLECLLGDKLTAFAPHTTGIQLGKNKELEIAKQLFDVAALFDVSENIGLIGETHAAIASKELAYRGLDKLTPQDVLWDTFWTAYLIGIRGSSDTTGEYKELAEGIAKLKGYVYSENFSLDSAILCASKAAVLAMMILKQKNAVVRFNKGLDLSAWSISNPHYNKLNKLKKTNPESFFYFYQAIETKNLPT